MKRILDLILSGFGIIILLPFFIIITLLVKFSSKGPVLYKQIRVGKNSKDFKILKFRTMYTGSDKNSLLTVGDKDNRITKIGYFLRKSKLDELPQLFNVLFGEMSLVGPRPEVRKYTNLYTKEEEIVLSVRPGITDYASIYFRNESEILKKAKDPEQAYINEILPKKLELNKKYIDTKNIVTDIKIIFMTFNSIISK